MDFDLSGLPMTNAGTRRVVTRQPIIGLPIQLHERSSVYAGQIIHVFDNGNVEVCYFKPGTGVETVRVVYRPFGHQPEVGTPQYATPLSNIV